MLFTYMRLCILSFNSHQAPTPQASKHYGVIGQIQNLPALPAPNIFCGEVLGFKRGLRYPMRSLARAKFCVHGSCGLVKVVTMYSSQDPPGCALHDHWLVPKSCRHESPQCQTLSMIRTTEWTIKSLNSHSRDMGT